MRVSGALGPLWSVVKDASTWKLGDYELISELARGGMGRVFLARRESQAGLERLYAVKVLHDHLADEPEAVMMLLDEARIAARIHHPNVVPITDLGEKNGSHFVVMDYVEGCTLAELLWRSHDRRSPRLVVPLVIDALRGLHAAHELADADGRPLDLIHRDFSPQNLLVGQDGVCRVTDFGIAKASARLTHTRSTVQKGKISYMPPEQLTENVELDRRVDLWAAGVVLWYALTGDHPFRAESEAATIHMILERHVPPPSTVGLRPPRCFDALCLRALQRDRDQRFDTAEQMADQLQAAAVRHDLLAPPSEIAAWVREAFGKELEQRRQVIRAVKDQGAAVTWITAPVLPRITLTPSSGVVRMHAESLSPSLPLLDSSQQQAALDRQTTARRKRAMQRTRTAVGVVVGSLAGFALCLLALFGFSSTVRRDPPPAVAARPARVSPAPEASSPALSPQPGPARLAEQPSQPAPQATDQVRITLRGVPRGATVRLDGNQVEGPELTVPRDGRERVVRIDLPGFVQWHQAFVATRSATLDVSLVPERGASGRSGSRPTKAGQPSTSLVREPGF